LVCNASTCICFCYIIPLKELRADIRFHKGFHGVTKDSALSLRPLNPLQRPHWHRWIRFHGRICFRWIRSLTFINIVLWWKLPFCIKIMLLKFFQGFCGLIETAEAAFMVSLKSAKLVPRSHWNRGSGFRGLIETAESDNFKQLSRISQQFWSHMRNGFSPWIRAPGGWLMKKLRVENLMTLSL
jgi:hypothetical protein